MKLCLCVWGFFFIFKWMTCNQYCDEWMFLDISKIMQMKFSSYSITSTCTCMILKQNKKRIIALINAEQLFSKIVYISRWHLWPEWQKQHQFKSFIHSHEQRKRRVNKSRTGQLGMLGFEVIYNDDSIQSSGVDWNSCVVHDSWVGKCESEDTHVRQFSSCSPSLQHIYDI